MVGRIGDEDNKMQAKFPEIADGSMTVKRKKEGDLGG